MSLNYKAIEQAVSDETNAGSFPQLIRAFKSMGIERYDYFVEEGFYRYHDEETFVDIQMNGLPQKVEKVTSSRKIQEAVRQAQTGRINFEEFCRLAGKAGISYWVSDLNAMTVTYCDLFGTRILVEPIPVVENK